MKQIVPGPCCQLTEIPALLSFDEIRLAYALGGILPALQFFFVDNLSPMKLPNVHLYTASKNGTGGKRFTN